MPKDLRGLLEPANKQSGNKNSQDNTPLAQRRSLTSPGEPRVFRVRSGFVCGLCGRLHGALDNAFNCLARCTFELRLRSPTGPTHTGNQLHFNCTVCGRGFANSDDAEQCFERCLGRMKPSAQFEQAIRRVQVRYAQRLASHGVRTLERIDPLAEHTKMLETLTKEQSALGRPATSAPAAHAEANHQMQIAASVMVAPPPTESSHATPPPAKQVHSKAKVAPAPVATPAVANLESLTEETLLSAEPTSQAAEGLHAAPPPFTHGSSAPVEHASPHAESVESFDPETQTAESTQSTASGLLESNDTFAQANDVEENTEGENAPQVQDPESGAESETLAALNQDITAMEAETVAEDTSSSSDALTAEMDELSANVGELAHAADDFASLENTDSSATTSALSALVSSNDISTETSGAGLAHNIAAHESTSGNSAPSALSMLTSSTLGNAFEEASEFAQLVEQPEIPETMGADVLAILQAPPEGENLTISNKQEKILKDKTIKIDEDVFAQLTDTSGDSSATTTVHSRKPEMKPYRRNNAKYCCSACTKEFFTKEQVEACFFSHPEAGSDEERKLLEKVEQLKAKSAA